MAEKTEDLNLPLSVVTRIVKESLGDGVNVSKEARIAISRAASVFVLHATTYANQAALAGKRKTLTAQDVITGVKDLDLHDFVQPLQAALQHWKAAQAVKKAAKNSSNSGASGEDATMEREGEEEEDEDEETQPPEKVPRTSLAPPTLYAEEDQSAEEDEGPG